LGLYQPKSHKKSQPVGVRQKESALFNILNAQVQRASTRAAANAAPIGGSALDIAPSSVRHG